MSKLKDAEQISRTGLARVHLSISSFGPLCRRGENE
jgi:hypothetical protein